jgi:[ribosomal protein S5]-alanine N-acetyltransferase
LFLYPAEKLYKAALGQFNRRGTFFLIKSLLNLLKITAVNYCYSFFMIELIPIKQTLEENQAFKTDTDSYDILCMTVEYYKIIGFVPPWIGYFAMLNEKPVGSAGFKGQPSDNKIEIAYGTFPGYQQQGIGTEICRQLVLLAQKTNPSVIVTARTLPENNYSTKILQKNNFSLLGTVWDKDDGDVWEWQYEKKNN